MDEAAVGAATDPLKESGAMTTMGGRARMCGECDKTERVRTEIVAIRAPRRHGISPASEGKTMRCASRDSVVALVAIALTLNAGHARSAADYDREARLAQEIVPTIVVGDAVYLETARRPRVLAILTEATSPAIAGAAVIVVHGAGVHPDWGLINGLRTGLAEAGMSTLSVQMPVLETGAAREQYTPLFPESTERIAAAVAYLRKQGATRIAVVSHSMGASMVDAYFASSSPAKLAAWVPIGMMNLFGTRPAMPVLDVTAERDFPQVLEAAPGRAGALPRDGCSKEVRIMGTDHFMDNRQKELVATIAPFLARALAGGCPGN